MPPATELIPSKLRGINIISLSPYSLDSDGYGSVFPPVRYAHRWVPTGTEAFYHSGRLVRSAGHSEQRSFPYYGQRVSVLRISRYKSMEHIIREQYQSLQNMDSE